MAPAWSESITRQVKRPPCPGVYRLASMGRVEPGLGGTLHKAGLYGLGETLG